MAFKMTGYSPFTKKPEPALYKKDEEARMVLSSAFNKNLSKVIVGDYSVNIDQKYKDIGDMNDSDIINLQSNFYNSMTSILGE